MGKNSKSNKKALPWYFLKIFEIALWGYQNSLSLQYVIIQQRQ